MKAIAICLSFHVTMTVTVYIFEIVNQEVIKSRCYRIHRGVFAVHCFLAPH